jgi:serine/threonine protein kinase
MTDAINTDVLAAGYRMHWYTIERVLGQGGFGITYLARDNNLDQRVAIKEYLPVEVATRRTDSSVHSRGDGSSERFRWGLERFLQEARTLARFDHPNIVRVYSVFEFNGTAYMVMRFEEGENLGAQLERRGNLPEKDLLRILLPILDGLELMHNAGFIHRDIKPDNIHIRNDGTPVVLDFGSARHAVGKARTLTILVAPGYAPFEQYYSSSENQGAWTDIYGLSATCYRAITGTPPLDAITRSKGILGSTREVMVPARTIGGGRYSGQLLAAIDHALEFAEKDRPQTIAAWRAELTGQPTPAMPTMLAATAAVPTGLTPAAAPPSVPAAVHSAGRWSGVKGLLVGAVLGALVATATVVVWMQPRGDQRIAEIERRLDQQRQEAEKAEQARRIEQAKKDEEQRRLAADTERKRIEDAKKSEPPSKIAAAPAPLVRRSEVVAPPVPVRVAPQQPQPASQSAPVTRPFVPPAPARDASSESKLPLQSAPVDTTIAIAPPSVQPPSATAKPPEAPRAAPQDAAGAVAHYRKLAQQGDAEAALRLGEMYEAGRGVAQSNNWAYSWYLIAERRGAADGKSRKDAVSARLQPRERLQAERFAEGQTGQAK